AFVDALAPNSDGWSINLDPRNIVYTSGNAAGNWVDRYGPSSLEAFTVSLDSASATPVTVNYSTADGTAMAGRDYTAASGTVTIPPGLTSQTILIQTLDDGVANPTKTFTVNLSNPVGATISRGQGTGSIVDGDSTKFYVADAGGTPSTYRYRITGSAFGNSALTSGDTTPRGVATTAAGTTVWVVDANKTVYVYTNHGVLLGSWAAGGMPANATGTRLPPHRTHVWPLAPPHGT